MAASHKEVQSALTDEVLAKSIDGLPSEIEVYRGFLQGTMMERSRLHKLSVLYCKKVTRSRKSSKNKT